MSFYYHSVVPAIQKRKEEEVKVYERRKSERDMGIRYGCGS